ncbi:MAG: M28 family peptidase [Sphingomicrobium sp.]|nr:M28 family peptidase [Sphingomonadales bacterium]
MPTTPPLLLALAAILVGAASPGPKDSDTVAWWRTTAALSSDAMEGRDTGSPALERAARLVAARLAAAGLKPVGDGGSWFQHIPLDEIALTRADLRAGGKPIAFLDDFTIDANAGLPRILSLPIAYRGYCAAGALGDVRGRLVICHGTHRAGLPTAADRVAAVRAAGAAGIATIWDPGFTVEPPRWPLAYERNVSIRGQGPAPDTFISMRLRAEALGLLVPGRDARALIRAGSAGRSLPSFDSPAKLAGRLTIATRHYSAPNVMGILPGTDPAKADHAIVLTAHLDGYGYGKPVRGDSIYNGTLDDAAYVALLIRLAERRHGAGFARPLIFAIVAGEEKGLLGSRWLVAHPPRPLSRIAADINLDQLRPIFPLRLLTVHAKDESTLGDDASAVAASMGIAVQNDPEPERNLLQRSDHWTFIKAGIPSLNFVFGYTPGSASERIYRQWYRSGYHRPQDDLKQPIDWQAAADFNRFFYALVARIADSPSAPAWKPGSKLRPAAR